MHVPNFRFPQPIGSNVNFGNSIELLVKWVKQQSRQRKERGDRSDSVVLASLIMPFQTFLGIRSACTPNTGKMPIRWRASRVVRWRWIASMARVIAVENLMQYSGFRTSLSPASTFIPVVETQGLDILQHGWRYVVYLAGHSLLRFLGFELLPLE